MKTAADLAEYHRAMTALYEQLHAAERALAALQDQTARLPAARERVTRIEKTIADYQRAVSASETRRELA